MKEYHKIQTVFLRDPDTRYKTLLEGQFAKQEFRYLQNNIWTLTEKVDGTCLRVQWDGERINFEGKTDRAQTPQFILDQLALMFPVEKFLSLELPPLCLYGEGYGARIQKGGGDYIPNGVSFILFDVRVGHMWLQRLDVEDMASKLDIKVVPIVGFKTLWEAIEMVRNGFDSQLRSTPPEGLVMRPEVELLNRYGERVITKLKTKDFRGD